MSSYRNIDDCAGIPSPWFSVPFDQQCDTPKLKVSPLWLASAREAELEEAVTSDFEPHFSKNNLFLPKCVLALASPIDRIVLVI